MRTKAVVFMIFVVGCLAFIGAPSTGVTPAHAGCTCEGKPVGYRVCGPEGTFLICQENVADVCTWEPSSEPC